MRERKKKDLSFYFNWFYLLKDCFLLNSIRVSNKILKLKLKFNYIYVCFTSYKNSLSLNNKCFCSKSSHNYDYKTILPIYIYRKKHFSPWKQNECRIGEYFFFESSGGHILKELTTTLKTKIEECDIKTVRCSHFLLK